MHPLAGLACFLAFLFLWGACAAWVVSDAQRRGRSGLAFFLLWICGPFCALIWLLVRPRTNPAERPAEGYTIADDALAAAAQLDMLGDWDEAVNLYRYAATRWPEHGDYINQCINAIHSKKAAAEP
jgi:hypothetical protein